MSDCTVYRNTQVLLLLTEILWGLTFLLVVAGCLKTQVSVCTSSTLSANGHVWEGNLDVKKNNLVVTTFCNYQISSFWIQNDRWFTPITGLFTSNCIQFFLLTSCLINSVRCWFSQVDTRVENIKGFDCKHDVTLVYYLSKHLSIKKIGFCLCLNTLDFISLIHTKKNL